MVVLNGRVPFDGDDVQVRRKKNKPPRTDNGQYHRKEKVDWQNENRLREQSVIYQRPPITREDAIVNYANSFEELTPQAQDILKNRANFVARCGISTIAR